MIEGLAIWGLAQATCSIFTPILEDLAKDVTKNAAEGYVEKAFKSVFSVMHKTPLTKATGRALQAMLKLIEDELLDADLSEDELREMMPQVKLFIEHQAVCACLKPLFLDPDYHLDPKTFADTWDQLDAMSLPENFSWQRITKRLTRKIRDIRNDVKDELKETFDTLQNSQNAAALKELAGLPPDFNLDNYREALVERFGNLSFDSLDTSGPYYNAIHLWSVFVPQSVRECQGYRPQLLELPKEHQRHLPERREIDARELQQLKKIQDKQRQAYFEQPVRLVLEVCVDSKLPFIVILGDPGSGKSTLLRFLALQWARNKNINERYSAPLPLLIELRDYNRWQCHNGKSFPRYLHQASTWHRLNQQTLDYRLKQEGRVLLLLDGLDEVFNPAEREQVVNDIHRFSNDYKHTRIIVTSRIHGYKAQRLRDAGFHDFMLQDFDGEQIEQFLQGWHEVTFEDKQEAELKRRRLAKAIRVAKPIQILAGNPLLLTMMAIINRYQELPRDRALLYKKAAEVLLQQWDTERSLQDFPGLNMEIDLRAKTAILRKIAYSMQTGKNKGEAANIIQGSRLTDLIEEYLYQNLHVNQARAAANALVCHLRERNFILCYLGADSYAFVHRTFLEYFCATYFEHRFHKEKSLSIDDLIEVFDQHCREDDWHEILRLICGQIDERFAGQIVEHLATRTDLDTWDGKTALPELPLAIWCLSEVQHLNRIEAGSKLLMTVIECFLQVKENREPSSSFRSFTHQLVAAAKAVGSGWPGKSVFKFMGQYPKYAPNDQHLYWPPFLCAVFEQRSWIEELAQCKSRAVRLSSLVVLAEYWPDDKTRKLLQERARNDEGELVRSTVLKTLAKCWQDDITRKFLHEQARSDEAERVRSTALETLIEHWYDDQTRKLLQERAENDEKEMGRRIALETLAKHWPDDDTRKLLQKRARNDEEEWVRRIALQILPNYWLDDKIKQFLQERARNDEGVWGRSTALATLTRYWPDDETRKLLQERAKKDNRTWGRCTALVILARHWPDDENRQLLQERAKNDKEKRCRSIMLKTLAKYWSDDETRKL